MIQLRTACLSAHLDSFCRKLNELVGLELVYQTDDTGAMRRRVGWKVNASYKNGPITPGTEERTRDCDVLIEMLREMDLMESCARSGKATVYVSERWLKPLVIKGIRLPAILRLVSPKYFDMVLRFVRLMDCSKFWVLPCGVHGVKDFVRLYKLLHGDIRCLFRSPNVDVERRLGGSVEGFPRVKLWGYFVEPSKISPAARIPLEGRMLKIFWCGRMLDWKRVDILIRAFKKVCAKRHASLLIVGEGAERDKLIALAGSKMVENLGWIDGKICFHGYVSSDRVRELMHESDVYVMPSNAEEGWGAAVSDALTEGCPVISTWEAGSSATLLPDENLYHANNVDELVNRLLAFNGGQVGYSATEWGGENAARKLLEIIEYAKDR